MLFLWARQIVRPYRYWVNRQRDLNASAIMALSLKTQAEANAGLTHAIGYAKFYSRSHDAVIRVYDEAGNVIETHEHAGEFKEP